VQARSGKRYRRERGKKGVRGGGGGKWGEGESPNAYLNVD